MTCEEFEHRFLAHLEPPGSAEVRAAGEAHLAGCAACRALARQLRELDAALTSRLRASGLSADFGQRLAKRLQVEATVLSEAQRAERKRQLQAEYEAGLAQFRPGPLRVAGLLGVLPHLALAALAGGLVWRFAPEGLNRLAAQGLSGADQTLLLTAIAGAVFVAIGLSAASPRTCRRLWSLG